MREDVREGDGHQGRRRRRTSKPGSDGKRTEIYASVEDSCGDILFFKTIAEKAGKQLNNATWTKAVNTMGPIDDQLVLGKWASLHTGKYDANDTFGLVAVRRRQPVPRETGSR